MSPYVALIAFPVVFLGELPDKTMFASLLMATRVRPWHVWLGAAAAFVVHVAIAVSVGAALLALLPRRAVDILVALGFAAGAVYAFASARSAHEESVKRAPSARNAVLGAFVVIFAAEWGDLTQILIANLAAKYGHPWSVAVGSLAALWSVAAIAVTGGATLLRFVSIRRARQLTAVVLLALSAYAAWTAAR
ncbi:MAG TPA: TMEM165/GDT1 family protein [Acidimicrobiales bacterium]|nr:TMEM165/GDT1 family protein [Acidimicrobiales bacterium]